MIPQKHLPDPKEFSTVSSYLKDIVNDDNLLVLGLDMGGYNLVPPFSTSLRMHKVEHKYYMLKQADDYKNGYRTVLGIKLRPYDENSEIVDPKEIIKNPMKYLLLFDENVEVGLSIIGGVAYCLENREGLGNFEKLYTFLMHDNRGNVAHFAVKRDYDYKKSIDLKSLFKKIAPKKYKDFEKRGLIDLIPDTTSIHAPQEEYHNGEEVIATSILGGPYK